MGELSVVDGRSWEPIEKTLPLPPETPFASPRQWESCDGYRSLPPVAMPSAGLQSVAIPADGIATDCNPGSKQQQTARVETSAKQFFP